MYDNNQLNVNLQKTLYNKNPSLLLGEKDTITKVYCFAVNCSSSVEPFKAVVEDVPPEMTIDTWSK